MTAHRFVSRGMEDLAEYDRGAWIRVVRRVPVAALRDSAHGFWKSLDAGWVVDLVWNLCGDLER